ncbi:GGDEF domain-containing phosphodiesterase [Selenomonas sp. TAMA-11512]|uniref:GGDEF domain-containing phosphodiesterase n=1 Tax=Selenomonas sp. TAMA-11512 TaxID=3095337 RepID=UPI0030D48937
MEILGALLILSLIGNAGLYTARRRMQKRCGIVEEELSRLRNTDTNTGLPNRRWMEYEIDKRLMELSEEELRNLYAVVFQIAAYGEIDSMHGRELKHKLLQSIWENVSENVESTIAACTRSGAGQVVALMKKDEKEELIHDVRRIVKHEEYLKLDGSPIRVSMKIGIRRIGEKGLTASEVLADAGLAAEEAHTVRVFDDELKATRVFQTRVESLLGDGLRRQEFQVWYQPKYDIRTKKCVGAEALVRWASGSLGFLFPGQFIRVFERTGFIMQLDYYMLGNVIRFQKKRKEEGKEIVPISVNQSRIHMQETKYLEHMKRLAKYFGDVSCIELELTETAIDFSGRKQRDHAIEVVRDLQDIGFSISMDDFGTGYSDISLLNELPLDVVKLDRTMLTASEDSERMQLVLRKVIELSEGLGMKVLCEGIETVAQEELLLRCGCRYGQGFLYGKPMPAEEFEAFLDAHI